ncbi:MAG TPA: ISKra4 family transposase [Candidatus Krumholzibacteria bacterium]|nr:ISKra4 family transposase [Candidatus Krumholzibacteria bacterium]
MQPQAINEEKPFAEADAKFNELKTRLGSESSRLLSHSEIEELLQVEGREVLRLLYQGHLDLRGPGDVDGDVVGGDRVVRVAGRIHDRKLQTVFGTVEVSRRSYAAEGHASLHPLDADLNLPSERYSHGTRRRVAEEIRKQSFDETVDELARTLGEPVPKRQVEELTIRAAQDFDGFYEKRKAASTREVAKTGDIVVISSDGKGVPMHTGDLRPATKKAAEKQAADNANEKPFSLGRPRSSEEARDRKRMATVAAVYTTAAFFRTPEDVVRELNHLQVVDSGESAKRPKPERKRVWASLEKTPHEVLGAAFTEALRRDPKRKKLWAALVDGNETQLDAIHALEREHELTISIIVDFIHVAGYVWKAAHAFHPRGSKDAETWVRDHLLEILRGRSSAVAGGMRRSATLRGLSGKERESVDDCADYLIKYRAFLHYDEYLAAGLPIATGVIEGACRYLVKDRMEITGAVWGLASAEAVLKLRALHASGDFDEYWSFHKDKEFRRNHASHYANSRPPAVRNTTRHGRLRLAT